MKKLRLVSILVLSQLLVIAFLIFSIYKKSSPNIVFNPVRKESVLATQVGDLKSFYEPAPNILDIINPWMPYKATNTINSDSLNERYDYEVVKKPGVFRIVTLGDSYTYGVYVDTKDNWPEKLEDMLNTRKTCPAISKYEVINLGVGGYDLQYSIERFKLRGMKYNPDLVVWFVKSDDYVQINELILPREKEIVKEMEKTGEFDRQVKAGKNYPSWNKAFEEFGQKYTEEEIFSLQGEILRTFDAGYTNPLIFVTFPAVRQEGKALIDSFIKDRPNTYFFNNLENIPARKDLQFPTDMHPNQKGHQIIASDVFNYLVSEGFLPCK